MGCVLIKSRRYMMTRMIMTMVTRIMRILTTKLIVVDLNSFDRAFDRLLFRRIIYMTMIGIVVIVVVVIPNSIIQNMFVVIVIIVVIITLNSNMVVIVIDFTCFFFDQHQIAILIDVMIQRYRRICRKLSFELNVQIRLATKESWIRTCSIHTPCFK